MAVAENISRSAPTVSSAIISDLSSSPEWQLVQRIVASPAFVRSTLLTNFLLYVCERKLKGKEDEITEHQIGVHALGRPDNYHPGEDNIVRNYARILRKRLEEFFEGDGHLEDLRILIPRGQYVPSFERAQPTPDPRSELDPVLESGESTPTPLGSVPEARTIPEPSARPSLFTRRNFIISASAATSCSALAWIGLHRAHANVPSQIYERFWSQIFSPSRESFIVTGDSGLVLLRRITGRDISLNEYVNGTLASDLRQLTVTSPLGKGSVGAGSLNFTSTTDLKIAITLDRVAMLSHATPKIRNARDMRLTEVKTSNGIFVGGPRANPWIELFTPRSNFEMKFYPAEGNDHGAQSIWNKRPKLGERQEYLSSSNAEPGMTYSMASFLPSLDDEGWVMLLQGQSLSGTGAAGEFVTNASSIAPVLNKARRSDGSIGPFEVILETQAVGTDAAKARIVVERYEPMKF